MEAKKKRRRLMRQAAVSLWWLQARLAIPTEPLMWITAAKLEVS